jgi:hypothetical protein
MMDNALATRSRFRLLFDARAAKNKVLIGFCLFSCEIFASDFLQIELSLPPAAASVFIRVANQNKHGRETPPPKDFKYLWILADKIRPDISRVFLR